MIQEILQERSEKFYGNTNSLLQGQEGRMMTNAM